jgi:hypothetical protein
VKHRFLDRAVHHRFADAIKSIPPDLR